MLLGRVIGTVWATRKDEKLEGMKLLVVQAVDLELQPLSSFVVAVDSVQAGVGEVVLLAQGSSARQTRTTKDRPVDAVVMAVVENLEVKALEELMASYEDRRRPIAEAIEAQPEI